MRPATRRFEPGRARRLACGLLSAAVALAQGCERAETGEADPPQPPLAERREAAARRGIESLIAGRDALGPDWAFSMFLHLEPVVRDPALAARCRAIVDEASRVRIAELPAEFSDPELLRPSTLRPLVAELVRREYAGEPWQEPAAALGELLARHGERFWAAAPLLQQLTFLHSFSVLGIETQRSLDDVVRELRTRWAQGDPEALLTDSRFMFALTHVFYSASGYMRRPLDPAAFGPEIGLLRRALRFYLLWPQAPRHFLDLQAEVLFALELLRVPEDDDMRAMAERLLRLQNRDGSWGAASGNHRAHATTVVVQALLGAPDAPGEPGVPAAADDR